MVTACRRTMDEWHKFTRNTDETISTCLDYTAFIASTAIADLFTFNFGGLSRRVNTTTFTANVREGLTTGQVERIVDPAGLAEFNTGWTGPEDFRMSMNLSSVTPTTAHGVGSFRITDVDGDAIAGDIDGDWVLLSSPGLSRMWCTRPVAAARRRSTVTWGRVDALQLAIAGFHYRPERDGVTFTGGWSNRIGAGVSGVLHRCLGRFCSACSGRLCGHEVAKNDVMAA